MENLTRHLILLRHGRTRWNAEERFQGHADTPLDEVGWAQAKRAAQALSEPRPDLVLSSDLQRAHGTAQVLADQVDLDVHLDWRLREAGVGTWEGLTHDEVRQSFPDEYLHWTKGRHSSRAGHEPPWEVADRAASAIREVLKENPDSHCVVVVTHAATARHVLGDLLDFTSVELHALPTIGNGHWSILELVKQTWVLRENNVGP